MGNLLKAFRCRFSNYLRSCSRWDRRLEPPLRAGLLPDPERFQDLLLVPQVEELRRELLRLRDQCLQALIGCPLAEVDELRAEVKVYQFLYDMLRKPEE